MSGVQFHLATDSSGSGTGGVLFQMGDAKPGTEVYDSNFDQVRILMWISGRFSDSERRYTMPEKEMLAVVRGLEECAWLVNYSPHSIKVYTDHKGIIDLMANRGCVHSKVS